MKLLRTPEVTSLKDFEQKDVHRFLNYCGTELYPESSVTSLPRGMKLGDIKRGKYKATDLGKVLGGNGVSIIFPANNREYKSKDYVFVGGNNEKFDKDFDIVAKVYDGVIEFPDGSIYAALSGMLPKYHTPNSSWQYRFAFTGPNSYPKPLISVPTNSKDWEEICKALTEFAIFLKLFIGAWFKIYIIPSSIESPYQKYFSSNGSGILPFIPSILSAGYNLFGYPLIMGKLSKAIGESTKQDINPGLRNKILRFGEKNYKDIYFVNLGTGSCFMDPKRIEDIRPLQEVADSKRLRTILDWILKAWEDGKYVIFYSDLDNSVAIAHEIGHYLEDKDGTLRKIQAGDKSGIFSNGFIKFFGFCVGALPAMIKGAGSAVAGWGETIAIATGLLLKSPLLFSEFMASYKGLDVMREAGCSEEEIETAKKFFKLAYGTYLAGAIHQSTLSPIWGRYIGGGIGFLHRLYKENEDKL